VGSDLIPVQVRQTDLSYYAALEPPAFALGARWVDLQAAMYTRLEQFKLRLTDIKVESTTANPGDLSVVCWMFNYGALARFRLDRVEVWSNNTRVAADPGLVKRMVVQTTGVLRSVSPDSHVTMHTLTVTIHGALPSLIELGAHIASYVTRRPEGPPTLAPNGVSFLCEFGSGQGQGSVILEQSVVVPGGAHLRVMSQYPGSISEGEVVDRAFDFLQTAAARIRLAVVWGP